MSKYATVENAEAIRNATSRALSRLVEAGKELADAFLLASDDYDNNADKLQQIVGTIGLLSSAVSVEHFTWADYARARARQGKNNHGE